MRKVEINDLKKLKAAHESVPSVRNVVLIHVVALMSVFKDVFSRRLNKSPHVVFDTCVWVHM